MLIAVLLGLAVAGLLSSFALTLRRLWQSVPRRNADFVWV